VIAIKKVLSLLAFMKRTNFNTNKFLPWTLIF
jgi:hypothetical protein